LLTKEQITERELSADLRQQRQVPTLPGSDHSKSQRSPLQGTSVGRGS